MLTAVITGVTGQDGSYLSELLLEKGYTVHGIVRHTTQNIYETNIPKSVIKNEKFIIHYADIEDVSSLTNVFKCLSGPIEVYNLAAQSHVGISFSCPTTTLTTNMIGTSNLLETIRQCNLISNVRFYQASTSEMFGKVHDIPQTENTVFHPRSPYGVSKLAAHMMVQNYRETYNMFACNGILFNHESPRRGSNFVTQKIVKGMMNVFTNNEVLELGNIESKRDWGHAKDYVKAMWLMLQQSEPSDYIVASGEQHSVRDFVESVVSTYNKSIVWEGSGVQEVGKVDGNVVVKINEEFYRPCEVDTLLGDPSKIKSIGWIQEYSFDDLVRDMVTS